MKIIFEYDDKNKIELTTDAEDIYAVIDEIEKALIAYGFHPDSIKEGFIEKAEEYKGE